MAKFREYYLSIILEQQKYQLLLKSGVDLKSLKRKLKRLPSSDQPPRSPSSHLPTPSGDNNGNHNNKSSPFQKTISHSVSKSVSKSGKGRMISNRNKITYSLLIDFETVKEFTANDFDIDINIQHFVEPLTADFIPIPSEFENCTVRQAAKNIFEQFVDDGMCNLTMYRSDIYFILLLLMHSICFCCTFCMNLYRLNTYD